MIMTPARVLPFLWGIAALLVLVALLQSCRPEWLYSKDSGPDLLSVIAAENRALGEELAFQTDRLARALLACPLRPPPAEAPIDDRLAAYLPPPPVPAEKPTPPPRPDPPRQQAQNRDLTIPEDAARTGDLSFLNGCWNSYTTLKNIQTGEPVTMVYCFSGNGQGELRIREQDGELCRAPARAGFDGGRLTIKSAGDINCPSGRGYFSTDVGCDPLADGNVSCRGEQRSGNRFEVQMQRN